MASTDSQLLVSAASSSSSLQYHFDDAYAHTVSFDFVQALHDFFPSDAPNDYATCLFFRRGDIIEVFNRDNSGWWDGASRGMRGWFPSNYVAPLDNTELEVLEDWQQLQHLQEQHPHVPEGDPVAASEEVMRSMGVSSASSSQVDLSLPVTMTTNAHTYEEDWSLGNLKCSLYEWESLMEDVVRQIAFLVDTCAAQHHHHIQLAVYHVVSAVRSVLTAASTVDKDSPLLKSSPELARQRKHVLNALSKLVVKGKEIQSNPHPMDDQLPTLAKQLLMEIDTFESLLRGPSQPTFFPVTLGEANTPMPESLTPAFDELSLVNQARLSTVSLMRKAVPHADAHHVLQNLLDYQVSVDELMASLHIAIEAFLVSQQRASDMLEVTRKAVEAVRMFLAVVEYVCSTVGDTDYQRGSMIPEDPQLVSAFLAKESAYMAITNLVTAVRAILSPQEADAADGLEYLRVCCDNVVRTVNTCAACIRICLQAENPPALASQEDVDYMRKRLESSIDIRRQQTLSVLGRKMTSLDALQHQLQHQLNIPSTTAELNEDSWTEESTLATVEEEGSTQMNRASSEPPGRRPSRRVSKLSGTTLLDDVTYTSRPTSRPTSHSPSRPSSLTHSSTATLALTSGEYPQESDTSYQHLTVKSELHPPISPRSSSITASSAFPVPTPTPTPTPPESKPPSLQLLASQSTPTKSRASGPRRRGLSVSSLRMSFRRNEDNQRAFLPPTAALLEGADEEEMDSGSEVSQPLSPADESAVSVKRESDHWFLRQRIFSEEEMIFNADGQVTGATVEALVEKLTLHEKSPDLVFMRAFFYNFRLFTTPETFVRLLIGRFSIEPPNDTILSEEERQIWAERVLLPVRLRVFNVIKMWLELYFMYEQDAYIEQPLVEFAMGEMEKVLPGLAKRMVDTIQRAFAERGNAATGKKALTQQEGRGAAPKSHNTGAYMSIAGSNLFSNLTIFDDHSDAGEKPPASVISRSLRNALRKSINHNTPGSVHINDFDPLELVRQLTLMDSTIFCRIIPSELIVQNPKKKNDGGGSSGNVRAMIKRSTRLANWVSDSILREVDPKKRAQMIKFWIKVCDNCLQLNNFNTLMAIRSALDSTSITRLKKTWEHVSAKYKAIIEPIFKVIDPQRNFAEYRQRLKNAMAPCLPFLGLYLTDITFIRDGNPDFRVSASGEQLINFDKYIKITRVLNEIDQFQIPYRLTEVEEIQRYVDLCLASLEVDDEQLYLRSLKLEPREEEADGNF